VTIPPVFIEYIVNESENSLLFIDRNHTITQANRSAKNLCPDNRNMIGMNCKDFFSRFASPVNGGYHSRINTFREQSVSDKLLYSDHLYHSKDRPGKMFGVTTHAEVNNGEIVQTMLVIKAMVEQKPADEFPLEQGELFSYLLDGMQEGMIVLNSDLEILHANNSYVKQTGLRTTGLKGRHCYEVSHNRNQPCYLDGEECSVKNAIDSGSSNKIIETLTSGGSKPLYVEAVAYPIKDYSGNVVCVVKKITDITGKIQMEEEIKNRVRELEEFYEIAVGREIKMMELKTEIKHLKNRLHNYKKESIA
jgi:PAS domain S-box-containing protein